MKNKKNNLEKLEGGEKLAIASKEKFEREIIIDDYDFTKDRQLAEESVKYHA